MSEPFDSKSTEKILEGLQKPTYEIQEPDNVCPECGGTGSKKDSANSTRGCPRCNGTGKELDKKGVDVEQILKDFLACNGNEGEMGYINLAETAYQLESTIRADERERVIGIVNIDHIADDVRLSFDFKYPDKERFDIVCNVVNEYNKRLREELKQKIRGMK